MHVLITAGPTREYLDDVRFLSNASSGRMGYCLADAAIACGWRVSLVSGPVALDPPRGAEVRRVTSARDMHQACLEIFPGVDGVIAVAAVADYRPRERQPGKPPRTDQQVQLELVPNPDILADLGARKTSQWTVGFAVEPQGSLGPAGVDAIARAAAKLRAKRCDAIVLNSVRAMESAETAIAVIDQTGNVMLHFEGPKPAAAEQIIAWIASHLG